ncbi:MAG: Do family serine endopeptidase [Dysgonamonadaceae bacterium]|jgi:Do/DeqQ family serine protease|nr:Do family serine endopeptidase [Dysgonamonadaceae bacterium]
MKINWKLAVNFLSVSALSASIAVGVYVYLNRNESQQVKGEFNQTGYHPVGLTVAAENTDFTLAAERSIHAVVHIKSIAKPNQREHNYFDPFEFFFGGQSPYYQKQPKVGFGSGVIISTDGYIVTNNHVIEGADEIEVTTNDEQVYTAKLIGRDEATDIALLKIEGENFPLIPFGDSEALKVGEWVLAVGNPFNLTSTVTAGIVSAKGRGSLFSGYNNRSRSQTQERIESYIQTDAAVNPGNSGGALVNTQGELVGINTAIYSETGNYIGYSFAIPINIVKKVVSDIKQYGIVQRALLGVSIIELPVLKEEDPDKYKQVKAKDGLYVAGFSSKSSAEKAGIKIGDVIVAINDRKIHNFQELRAQISLYNPGDIVNVQIQRGDELKSYKVELKNDQGTTEAITGKRVADVLGASLSDITLESPVLGIKNGVKVTDLKNGKLRQAGVREGFIILVVNDENIKSAKQLENMVESIMKNAPEEKGLFIKGLYPNGRVTYYAINLDD